MTKQKKDWIEWFDKQTKEDQRTIAISAIESLIQSEEVSFKEADEYDSEEYLYCVHSGEDLRTPF
jgi:hypothetical protein